MTRRSARRDRRATSWPIAGGADRRPGAREAIRGHGKGWSCSWNAPRPGPWRSRRPRRRPNGRSRHSWRPRRGARRVGEALGAREAARGALDRARDAALARGVEIKGLKKRWSARAPQRVRRGRWVLDSADDLDVRLAPIAHAVRASEGLRGARGAPAGRGRVALLVDDARRANAVAAALAAPAGEWCSAAFGQARRACTARDGRCRRGARS